MQGTADCAPKRPGFLSMLGAVTEVAEAEVKVESMKQNKRAIVRRRTQQLVYLELGRENGGVMLNLSEEGCGFQAITPVKIGETRFGFQINGGRRIAGDAEIVWADESGVMGGLRFVNLPPEARKEIRSWLEETNAPMEYGYASAQAATAAAAGASVGARPARTNIAPEPYPQEVADVRAPQQQEAPPPPQAWNSPRAAGYPGLEEQQRYTSPFSEAIVPYGDPNQGRSTAVWRGIAVTATVVAVLALGIMYQKDLGNSLIWLGETMSGKTKASTVVPSDKAADGSATTKPEATPADAAEKNPSGLPESDPVADSRKVVEDTAKLPTAKQSAVTPDASNVSDRPVSALDRQSAAAQKPEPSWSETDSVETLWGAVQAGSVSAEVSLAERFARGAGVNKNCDQAKVLMKAAANKGNREARMRLYELETGGCQ
jgi:hypothetical protein